MSDMENNVVSLETAKKLKASGFEQDTVYRYYVGDGYDGKLLGEYEWNNNFADDCIRDGEIVAAPSAQEIADQLPEKTCMVQITWQIYLKKWLYLASEQEDSMWLDADTMAEALAALWLRLHEALPSDKGLEGDKEGR